MLPVCDTRCADQPASQAELAEVLWRWLGAPGHPLVSAGVVASERELAEVFVARVPETGLHCGDLCLTMPGDLEQAVHSMWRAGLLAGLEPEGHVPSDLLGVGPMWSASLWYPSDELCLDRSGKARYGKQDGRICVSPELDAALRRDVALHELGHFWHWWGRAIPSNGDNEADADCWAHIHGAAWTHYVDNGCATDADRSDLLVRYGRSLGVT